MSDELKPCPFCGEHLVYHEDHHGHWYAHRSEPGPCIDSTIQILDQTDATKWNHRPIEAELERKLAEAETKLRAAIEELRYEYEAFKYEGKDE